MEHQQRFGELRSIIYTLSGEARWAALIEHLDGWPLPQLQDEALPYLHSALRDDPTPRQAPPHWVHLHDDAAPLHPACALARILDLSDAPLKDHGAQRLARDPALVGMEQLVLASAQIGDEGALALAEAPLTALTKLDLWGNQIGDKGAHALAWSPQLARLKQLDLGYNQLGPEGARALATSPHMAGLSLLVLSGNQIGAEGAHAIANSPRLAGLTQLVLDGHQISAEGRRALAKSPYLNPAIRKRWRR